MITLQQIINLLDATFYLDGNRVASRCVIVGGTAGVLSLLAVKWNTNLRLGSAVRILSATRRSALMKQTDGLGSVEESRRTS